jgi:ABC-2 type transport system ATP-binding protein
VAESKYAIEAHDLKKSYGKTEVLKGISLKVERGTLFALLGPNGAGKTTTVRILSTLLGFQDGKVTVEGFDVRKQADEVRSVIGLTGQSAAVDEMLTGRENLEMMGRLYRLTKESAKARAQELLKDFDLVDAANRPAKTYSGGMRRRLDLAVSLIATPPIIFLDEPTTGLDPRSRISMWNIIEQLKKDGATILLTTQYLEEADQLADKIVVIDDGQVIAEGTPTELKAKVGKDRLELSFENDGDFKKAKKVIDGEASSDDIDTLTITLTINDVNKDVAQVLDKLNSEKIKIVAMGVHKPTLDDVFLSVTGKTKEKTESEEEK